LTSARVAVARQMLKVIYYMLRDKGLPDILSLMVFPCEKVSRYS